MSSLYNRNLSSSPVGEGILPRPSPPPSSSSSSPSPSLSPSSSRSLQQQHPPAFHSPPSSPSPAATAYATNQFRHGTPPPLRGSSPLNPNPDPSPQAQSRLHDQSQTQTNQNNSYSITTNNISSLLSTSNTAAAGMGEDENLPLFSEDGIRMGRGISNNSSYRSPRPPSSSLTSDNQRIGQDFDKFASVGSASEAGTIPFTSRSDQIAANDTPVTDIDDQMVSELEHELTLVSKSFRNNEMRAFGEESDEIFQQMQNIRQQQQQLAEMHCATEKELQRNLHEGHHRDGGSREQRGEEEGLSAGQEEFQKCAGMVNGLMNELKALRDVMSTSVNLNNNSNSNSDNNNNNNNNNSDNDDKGYGRKSKSWRGTSGRYGNKNRETNSAGGEDDKRENDTLIREEEEGEQLKEGREY